MNPRIANAHRFLYKQLWKSIKLTWSLIKKRSGTDLTNTGFSIGIVTYVERFETYFKPLIVQLVTLFPDTEIVVCINGYHDHNIQQSYLKKVSTFLKKFRNLKHIDFEEAQSLSKLWNLLIINSNADRIFILNDDLRLSPFFRKNLERSGILNTDISLINGSWSHFMISKQTIKEVGWFDERFPSMGNEDEDYECRLTIKAIQIRNFKFRHIQNLVLIPEHYSYGIDVELINVKYMKSNKVFFDSKWGLSEKACKDCTYVASLKKYVYLKENMQTPDFYPDYVFQMHS